MEEINNAQPGVGSGTAGTEVFASSRKKKVTSAASVPATPGDCSCKVNQGNQGTSQHSTVVPGCVRKKHPTVNSTASIANGDSSTSYNVIDEVSTLSSTATDNNKNRATVKTTFSLPDLPTNLKNIQQYLDLATNYEKTDPSVTYWCRLRALHQGFHLQKTKEDLAYLLKLMEWIGKIKQELKSRTTVSDLSVAQVHLENIALKFFSWANYGLSMEQCNKIVFPVISSAWILLDVCSIFGDFNEEMTEKTRYAQWCATNLQKDLTVDKISTQSEQDYSDHSPFVCDGVKPVKSPVTLSAYLKAQANLSGVTNEHTRKRSRLVSFPTSRLPLNREETEISQSLLVTFTAATEVSTSSQENIVLAVAPPVLPSVAPATQGPMTVNSSPKETSQPLTFVPESTVEKPSEKRSAVIERKSVITSGVKQVASPSSRVIETVSTSPSDVTDDGENPALIESISLTHQKDQWSPVNPEGKKTYDRLSLLKLQDNPLSRKKPEGLPSLEGSTVKRGDFTPPFVKIMPTKELSKRQSSNQQGSPLVESPQPPESASRRARSFSLRIVDPTTNKDILTGEEVHLPAIVTPTPAATDEVPGDVDRGTISLDPGGRGMGFCERGACGGAIQEAMSNHHQILEDDSDNTDNGKTSSSGRSVVGDRTHDGSSSALDQDYETLPGEAKSAFAPSKKGDGRSHVDRSPNATQIVIPSLGVNQQIAFVNVRSTSSMQGGSTQENNQLSNRPIRPGLPRPLMTGVNPYQPSSVTPDIRFPGQPIIWQNLQPPFINFVIGDQFNNLLPFLSYTAYPPVYFPQSGYIPPGNGTLPQPRAYHQTHGPRPITIPYPGFSMQTVNF